MFESSHYDGTDYKCLQLNIQNSTNTKDRVRSFNTLISLFTYASLNQADTHT